MFNEDNTIEQMAISTLSKVGWKYVEAENLDRDYTDVMVESMVRDALIRLNLAIAIMVEHIVNDIDDIVKIVRFDSWQDTNTGRNEVKKALRSVVWIKYKIKDKEVFNRAYSYIEQYY